MSQSESILKHLQAGKPIDAQIALRRFGCFRLAARIEELRHRHEIHATLVRARNGKRFARYWLSSHV